jgi:hypothetical protein
MHNQDTVNQFIEARARSIPYAQIADHLKVSRCTLIAWGQKYKTEIDALRAVQAEAIRAKYLGTREQEIEFLAQRLQRLEATFDQHKPIYIPIRQLTDMIRITRERLDAFCVEPMFPKEHETAPAATRAGEPKN